MFLKSLFPDTFLSSILFLNLSKDFSPLFRQIKNGYFFILLYRLNYPSTLRNNLLIVSMCQPIFKLVQSNDRNTNPHINFKSLGEHFSLNLFMMFSLSPRKVDNSISVQ
ncbi:hypothetical protein THIOM_003780 [Candidatus Thiomargarita nelsonii]|uniref:Uncharacterized protein n=1 Tax=Candidatus Thiomargarita nelsonii TaxID=1003181 RepID=A0A176RXR8_9GAMM|nr:hypothetical protein THIOM_003780 [Candidatus Thiomargarita nelsonii]